MWTFQLWETSNWQIPRMLQWLWWIIMNLVCVNHFYAFSAQVCSLGGKGKNELLYVKEGPDSISYSKDCTWEISMTGNHRNLNNVNSLKPWRRGRWWGDGSVQWNIKSIQFMFSERLIFGDIILQPRIILLLKAFLISTN